MSEFDLVLLRGSSSLRLQRTMSLYKRINQSIASCTQSFLLSLVYKHLSSGLGKLYLYSSSLETRWCSVVGRHSTS
jgi:hypothetical protein